jgi:glycopeptide antibiotics resistance protein
LLFLLFYVHSIFTVAQCYFSSPLFLHAVERLHMNYTVPFDILPYKSSLRYLHMLIPAHYTHLSHVTCILWKTELFSV